MVRFFPFLALTLLLTLQGHAQNQVSHEMWTTLLGKYVSPYGLVNYKGFKADEVRLDEYLGMLSANPPKPTWRVEEQEAFWINAYNAFTIKLILKNYPVKSIKDIKQDGKNAWNIPFIKIGEKNYSLDYIEKTMLHGQFNDSRLHFVLHCSARSCPPLKNSAYTAGNLNIELRLAARRFINDNRFNNLSKDHLQLSELFDWHKDDFLKEVPSIQSYIDENTPHLHVSPKASVTFMHYDWNLNEQ